MPPVLVKRGRIGGRKKAPCIRFHDRIGSRSNKEEDMMLFTGQSLRRLIRRLELTERRHRGRTLVTAVALFVTTGPGLAGAVLQLPDVGNGSQAKGVFIDHTSAGLVAGDVVTQSGRRVPVVWTVDFSDGSATAAPLPVPGTAEGTANSIVIDVIGAGVVAGTVTTADGIDHAVVWRQNTEGEWVGRPLPDLNKASQAKGVLIDYTSAGLVAGDVVTQSGRRVPVVWTVDFSDGSATAAPLPVPGTAEGTANSIVIDVIDAGVVAGAVRTANGVDHAVVWRQNAEGEWVGRPLPDLGSGSQAKGVLIDFTSAGLVAGDVITQSGRRVPVVWTVDSSDGSATAAPLPVPGTAEGTANSVGIDSTEGGVVVGTVSTANGRDHAVVWRQNTAGEWAGLPLPDQGNGSQANGVLIDATASGVVVGVVTTGDGLDHAVLWRE